MSWDAVGEEGLGLVPGDQATQTSALLASLHALHNADEQNRQDLSQAFEERPTSLQMQAALGQVVSSEELQHALSGMSSAGQGASLGDLAGSLPLQGGLGATAGTAVVQKQVCTFFVRTGTCAYGDRCKFIHPQGLPPPRLNSRGYPLRAQEPDCAHYLKKGWCAFGLTCKFNHPEVLPSLLPAFLAPGSSLAAAAAAPTYVTMQAAPQASLSSAAYATAPQAAALGTYTLAAPGAAGGPTLYYMPQASIGQSYAAGPMATGLGGPGQLTSAGTLPLLTAGGGAGYGPVAVPGTTYVQRAQPMPGMGTAQQQMMGGMGQQATASAMAGMAGMGNFSGLQGLGNAGGLGGMQGAGPGSQGFGLRGQGQAGNDADAVLRAMQAMRLGGGAGIGAGPGSMGMGAGGAPGQQLSRAYK